MCQLFTEIGALIDLNLFAPLKTTSMELTIFGGISFQKENIVYSMK